MRQTWSNGRVPNARLQHASDCTEAVHQARGARDVQRDWLHYRRKSTRKVRGARRVRRMWGSRVHHVVDRQVSVQEAFRAKSLQGGRLRHNCSRTWGVHKARRERDVLLAWLPVQGPSPWPVLQARVAGGLLAERVYRSVCSPRNVRGARRLSEV